MVLIALIMAVRTTKYLNDEQKQLKQVIIEDRNFKEFFISDLIDLKVLITDDFQNFEYSTQPNNFFFQSFTSESFFEINVIIIIYIGISAKFQSTD